MGEKHMISDQELNKALLPMRFFWLFLFLTPIFYLLVGLYLEPTLKRSFDKKTLETVKMALYVISFITLVGTGYVRNHILSRQENLESQNRSFNNSILQRYFVSMIIALALSESIGIYGLILFYIGKDHTDLYLLTFISAAIMLFYFPRKAHLRTLTQHSSTDS
jgi:F0F1-type ATP synthase membrane subunit c/vacuolar-type H+-ATPase subunit K